MYKKLCFLISFLLVFGMVGSAFAGTPPAGAVAVFSCEQGGDPNILYDSVSGWDGVFGDWNAGSWDVSDYMVGSGALDCGEDGLYIIADHNLIDDVGDNWSLAVWIKPELDPEDNEGAMLQARPDDYYFTMGLSGETMHMRGPSKDAPGSANAWFPQEDRGEWSHWAFVKDATALMVYRDGIKLAASPGGYSVPLGPFNTTVEEDASLAIGSEPGGDHGYEGKIDDYRVYHRTLSSAEILAYVGNADMARDPSPYSNINAVSGYDEMDVLPLTWTAGDNAADVNGHHVYFGTDRAAVETRDSSVDKGLQTAASFAPDPGLDFDTTYYWAIDEVNDVTTWSGMLWVFALGSSLDVDLMNSYNSENPPDDNWIFNTWEDGFVNGTGSQVGYLNIPFEERDETYEGDVSMPFYYDNSANPLYSEASALVSNDNITVGSDWTVGSPTALELWFYGADPDNDPVTLYMGIKSTSSNVVTSDYTGDTTDVNEPEWHRFNAPLADFSAGGVDLNDVQEIYIGAGNRTNPSTGGEGLLFIDTIRLYPARCLRDLTGLEVDWNEDCIVDGQELEVFSGEWLVQDMMAAPTMFVWLKLDDINVVPVDGKVAIMDSSEWDNEANITLYDGNEPNDVLWVEGECYNEPNYPDHGAWDTAQTGNVIHVTNLPIDAIRESMAMTITFWWYNYAYVGDDSQGCWVEALGGEDPDEWSVWAIDWEGGDCIRIWDAEDDNMWCAGSFDQETYKDEWLHMAFELSQERTAYYLNGVLNGTDSPFGSRSGWQYEEGPGADVGSFRFGSHHKWSDGADRCVRDAYFDDIRIYDGVLPEAAIQGVMDCQSSGGGAMEFYVPLISIANLVPKVGDEGVYNEDNIDVVNFLDYAVFADSWLVSSPPMPE